MAYNIAILASFTIGYCQTDDCCLSNHVPKYVTLFHKPPQFVRNLTKKPYCDTEIC